MVRLFALDVRPLADDALFHKYYALQPAWRREKTDMLRQKKDRLLSLGAGILLQSALPGADLEKVCVGENGKPYLPGGIHFNLSHAGDLALCAVGAGALGCDIEQERAFDLRVARRFFCPAETALLEAAGARRQELFFRLWTLKESYLKAVGKVLTRPLNTFCVTFENDLPRLEGYADVWRLAEFETRPDYRCAVCAPAGEQTPENVEFISL